MTPSDWTSAVTGDVAVPRKVTAISRSALPALTAEQMRAVDRAMVEDMRIALPQMMENAGRNLAELALARFDAATVLVLAGPGATAAAA